MRAPICRSLLLMLLLVAGRVLAADPGAGGKASVAASPTAKTEARILCSTFPIYLFTRDVAAGVPGLHVDLMLSAGLGCPHDYALTPQDMKKIGAADMVVINGLGMESFVEGEKDGKNRASAADGPLRRANPRAVVLDSSKGVEGLLNATPDAGEAEPEGEYNPHLFASPRMAARVVRNIGEQLAALVPAQAEALRANAGKTAARFDALAGEFADAAKGFAQKRIVTEHDVFDYLARDAGLEVAAVVEEEPGQEPSAAKMLAIVKRVREAKVTVVFTEPQYPARVGETIAKEAGATVATLDPVASGPDNPPMDYYETTMRKNLETLKKMLGSKAKG